jgi:hypothetical protein
MNICQTRPYCRCVGPNKWDQCSCAPDKRPRDYYCRHCSARLVTIDVDTGEPMPNG